MRLGIILGLAAGAAVLAASGSAQAVASPSLNAEAAWRVAAVRGLAAEAGLPDAWGDFFALVAWRESKGNPNAVNDSALEAGHATTAFERNRARYAGCGHPDSAYTFGSAGWFGILPANGLVQLGEAFECLPPDSMFNPRIALAIAVGFARGLMNWDGFRHVPTWLNLRAMWGLPAKGGDSPRLAAVRSPFSEDAADVGLPASWLDQRPPPLPMTGAEVLRRLQVA
ncbi:MAG: hypothetical protein K0V04_31630 [Deltaproteobacteria bacterium]|nr:hypothetical protein [Deltaproteobacteria bacterium]